MGGDVGAARAAGRPHRSSPASAREERVSFDRIGGAGERVEETGKRWTAGFHRCRKATPPPERRSTNRPKSQNHERGGGGFITSPLMRLSPEIKAGSVTRSARGQTLDGTLIAGPRCGCRSGDQWNRQASPSGCRPTPAILALDFDDVGFGFRHFGVFASGARLFKPQLETFQFFLRSAPGSEPDRGRVGDGCPRRSRCRRWRRGSGRRHCAPWRSSRRSSRRTSSVFLFVPLRGLPGRYRHQNRCPTRHCLWNRRRLPRGGPRPTCGPVDRNWGHQTNKNNFKSFMSVASVFCFDLARPIRMRRGQKENWSLIVGRNHGRQRSFRDI